MKKPRRVYSTSPPDAFWRSWIKDSEAVTLKNGENPINYPNQAVAFETQNFGWILSKPDINGSRRVLLKY